MVEKAIRPRATIGYFIVSDPIVGENWQYWLYQNVDRFPLYVNGGGSASCACASVSSHSANSAGTSSFPASMASIHESSHWKAEAILIGVQRITRRHWINRSGDMMISQFPINL